MSKKSNRKSGTKASKRAVKASRKSTTKPIKQVTKVGKKPAATKKSLKFHSRYPRATTNPFMAGSSYGIAYDILSAHPEGMLRQKLIEELAKVTGKPVKNAGYDAAVVLSAKDSPTGKRHPSSREGYWIEKTNDHVRLRTE